MQNFLLMKPTKKAEDLSADFGYAETLFIDRDFVIITGENRKKVVNEISRAHGKLTIYRAASEEMLRFVLEKTAVNIVVGIESIHKKDSLHYLRGGLDQVLCRITADRNKIIAFSFSDIVQAKNREKLLARMMANLKLCQHFKVKTLFSGFFTDLKDFRSASDLAAFLSVLQQNDRNIFA